MTSLFGLDGELRMSSRKWRTTRPKRTATNCSAASKEVATARVAAGQEIEGRPFFLASDGNQAATYGVRAYA